MGSLSIGKAWEETSAFLSREAGLVAPVALAMFAVPAALARWANPADDFGGSGLGFLLFCVALLSAMIGQMTIAALAIGWSGSIGAALSKAARRVWGMLGAAVIVFLPIAIVAVVAMVAILGNAGITDPAKITPDTLAVVPGFAPLALALTLVFLFVAVRIFPLSAVAISETSSPIKLLSRSWQLTKGHFGRLIAVLLLVLIASTVATMAIKSVIGSVMTLASGEPQPFNLTAMVIGLAEGVVTAAISAVSSSLIGRIYVQLSAGQASVPEVKREG